MDVAGKKVLWGVPTHSAPRFSILFPVSYPDLNQSLVFRPSFIFLLH